MRAVDRLRQGAVDARSGELGGWANTAEHFPAGRRPLPHAGSVQAAQAKGLTGPGWS